MKKFASALALVLGLGAGAASATTYDFTDGNAPAGLGYGCASSTGPGCAVSFGPAGLGVASVGDEFPWMIDSDDGFESLIINFGRYVTVRTLVIGLLNWVDDFTIETRQGSLVFGPRTPSRILNLDLYTDFISITALPDATWQQRDIFTVAGLTTAVPLPAGGLLLLGGLGGLAALRRRKRA